MQACGRLVARLGEQDVDRDIGAGIDLDGGVTAAAMGDLGDPAIDDRYVAARQIGPDIGRNVVTSGENRQFVGPVVEQPYGWKYDFNGGGLKKARELPAFLLPIRDAAAASFGIESASLEQALLLEYPPGSTIGWHRDRPVFGDVVGISLLSVCTFRFRRKAGGKWERRSLTAEPRSAYILQGPARKEWEHSIPAVPELRYSITFRSVLTR